MKKIDILKKRQARLKEDITAIEIYRTGQLEKTTLERIATESLARL